MAHGHMAEKMKIAIINDAGHMQAYSQIHIDRTNKTEDMNNMLFRRES